MALFFILSRRPSLSAVKETDSTMTQAIPRHSAVAVRRVERVEVVRQAAGCGMAVALHLGSVQAAAASSCDPGRHLVGVPLAVEEVNHISTEICK